MMDHVDWANLMSYDLHGTWDIPDTMGNHILAHNNLTEIKEALNLFWRNNIEPDKVNLGVGFYGRSFQLSNPSCSQPGCLFKGGASPGVCTGESGTLSYSEIMSIMKQDSLSPQYDEENAVKYITWNSDQWVSYDDRETFQQKIEFANDLGLGGLHIWALDLDTPQLDALQGLIYPKKLGGLSQSAETEGNWEDAPAGDCRTTECANKSCRPGELKITEQWCNDQSNNALCCPLASAPDPSKCQWHGTPPSCNGQCFEGQVALQSNRKGNGQWCHDGRQFYCCDVPAFKQYGCEWSGCGENCKSGTISLTWAYDGCPHEAKKHLCCAEKDRWENCGWHGKYGSCFDNHCDTGHQIELANKNDGEGMDCGPRIERTRVFCCDLPHGKSPFLPVPLDHLFPHPPPGDSAETKFKLKVDHVSGSKIDGPPSADDPHDAAFGFFVLTSPEEVQVSLDKRDGSHWEVFDCFDSVSEETQTVRMICTDFSEQSNCHKIHLGHGAPGTIIEMPEGCGPGKYAVVKQMSDSANQALPDHLSTRSLNPSAAVFDLTFDYDFSRVPRDIGDTQMRLDFSNEDGYWDKVVDKAVDRKRKRSLEDFGGSRKRLLEAAWRDDKHLDGLSAHELHKRWFGSDILDWLKGLLNGVKGGPKVSYGYSDNFKVILLDEEADFCPIGPITPQARLTITAETNVQVETNFGLTLIASLPRPGQLIDLSQSYVYFRNAGEVTATFTLDAMMSASFSSGDKLLLSADRFGATFSVPGILTVGPNFKLLGSVEGSASLAAHLESQVKIAEWDVQQTFPDANHDWDPQATKHPNRDGTQRIGEPTFNYSVSADGHLTAHIIPMITFGIDFNEDFISVDSATINLVADGFITIYASASATNAGNSFCYGADAGTELYATVKAPKVYGWDLSVPKYQIAQLPPVSVVPKTCPIEARDLDSHELYHLDAPPATAASLWATTDLAKRSPPIGPLLRLSDVGLSITCPGSHNSSNVTLTCPLCGDDDEDPQRHHPQVGSPNACGISLGRPDEPICGGDTLARRGPEGEHNISGRETTDLDEIHATLLEKRASKTLKWSPRPSVTYAFPCPNYPDCTEAENNGRVTKYYTFGDSNQACSGEILKFNKNQKPKEVKWQTDHVYETQFMTLFFKFLTGVGPIALPSGYTPASDTWISEYVMGVDTQDCYRVNGHTLWLELSRNLGGGGPGLSSLALVDGEVNGVKGVLFGLKKPDADVEDTQRETKREYRNVAGVFQYLKFNSQGISIWEKMTTPSNQMETDLWEFDQNNQWNTRQGELGRPAGAPNGGGLRACYCYFIDQVMATVELNARTWHAEALAAFTAEWGGPSASAEVKSFIDNAMNGKGLITPAAMRFPRSVAGPKRSEYGMWGNAGLPAPF